MVDSVRDIYENKDKWEYWKTNNKTIKGLTKYNSKFLLDFLTDMESGQNISPKAVKGPRSETTLLNLKDHNKFYLMQLKKDINKCSKDDIHKIDMAVRNGKILKQNKKKFKSFGNYNKDFKNLCGWGVRTGRLKTNIAEDLSKKTDKPKWVYLDETQFKKLANHSRADYRPLIWFFYDTGGRVKELYNVKVNDFSENFTKVKIRVAKTFERTICLKLSSELIKDYVSFYNLKGDDYLIQKKTATFNKYLRELAKKIFGEGESQAKEQYSKMSLYDIRHCSSCYWLKRYEKDRGLMYRFGWTSESMIRYYSEFLGLNDEITDEDMVLGEDKTEYQNLKKENESIKKDIEELRKYKDIIGAMIENAKKDKEGINLKYYEDSEELLRA